MRKVTLLLVVVMVSLTALSTAGQTLSTRGVHHELRIQRTGVPPDLISYAVVVTDLDTGSKVLDTTVTGRVGQPVDATGPSGDAHVRVHLSYSQHFFSATLDVWRGETILDNFRTWWQLEPRQSTPPSGVVGGVVDGVVRGAEGITAPGAYRVGGDVKAPVVIKRIDPVYPEEARRARISGVVILEVLIGADGLVKQAMILKPLPYGLDQAALEAVRQWMFKPGTLNGQPVPVIFNLTTSFKLDGAQPPPPDAGHR